MRKVLTATMCSLMLFCASRAIGWETWYVDASVATPGDGTSWPKAFKRIQHGIDAAKNGDIVMVAQGEYRENIRFKGKNISLTGMDRATTIISGNSAGPVVTFLGTEDESCSLSEFAMHSGLAPNGGGILGNGCRTRIQNNTIASNVAEECGGGLHNCDGLIQGNTIMQNHATFYGGGLYDCDGMIYNNDIFWNFAFGLTDEYAPEYGHGGALYGCDGVIQANTIHMNQALQGGGLYGCSATIQYNAIESNWAVTVTPPGFWTYGGAGGGLCRCGGIIQYNGIHANTAESFGGGLAECNGTIRENEIFSNTGESSGGGLAYCDGLIQGNYISRNDSDFCGALTQCNGKILNNFIFDNRSESDAGGLGFCDASIRGNLIAGNAASHGKGGGLYRCHGHISCNTIVRNWADQGGGLYWCAGTVRNNIVWHNSADVGPQIFYQTNPTYCCIEGWAAGGVGNTYANPVFADPDGPDNDVGTLEDNDYRLWWQSPCIDEGYNEPWMTSGARDLDGNNRVFKGSLSSTVDMGAYEFGSRVFQIVEVKRISNGGVRLTWDGEGGETYVVWSRSSMPSGGIIGFWTNEGTVASQGATTIWTDNSPSSNARFYRVELK